MSRVIASSFALASFAVAIIAGIAAMNPPALVLGRALIAMLLCYPIGFIVGMVCERIIDWHVASELSTSDSSPMDASSSSAGADAAPEEVITV